MPETLIPALDELEAGWRAARDDDAFHRELHELLTTYAGRPTPLTRAERFAPDKRLYLKREDLLHTGAHKLNNALGQAVLARRLGKQRIVAETGAGQHGVATATVCARFGLDCVVYMGSEDMRRQAPNVERMKLLGAEVRPVEFGTRTLKEATSEAIRDWITNVETTYYLIGSCVGPAPYPELVRDLQRVIGDEAREQFQAAEGRLPEVVVACVGGGSNAIGAFYAFIDDADVRLVGVEAAGAASLGTGRSGVLHGARSSILADADGQIADAHSISAGPRLPGRRPRARRAARLRPRRRTSRAPTRRRSSRSTGSPRPRASSPRSRARMRSPARSTSTRSSCSCASPAAATRTSPRCSRGEPRLDSEPERAAGVSTRGEPEWDSFGTADVAGGASHEARRGTP